MPLRFGSREAVTHSLRFNARVGHNSRFIGLSDDDYEELDGVGYRVLTVLLWIVSGVSTFPFCFQTH